MGTFYQLTNFLEDNHLFKFLMTALQLTNCPSLLRSPVLLNHQHLSVKTKFLCWSFFDLLVPIFE